MNPVLTPSRVLPFAVPFASMTPTCLSPVRRYVWGYRGGTDCGHSFVVVGSERSTR